MSRIATSGRIMKLENWLLYVPPTLLSVLAFVFYHPSLNYNFQFDDVANIRKMFYIRHHDFWGVFLKNPRWISMWLNFNLHSWVRFEPFTYRFLSVCFHTLTALAFFYFVKIAFSKLKATNYFKIHATSLAYCAALLFLLHPLQTQTVSYVIQGQMEGLAALFMVSTCLWFMQWSFAQNNSIQKYLYLGLMYTSAFLACGTKEITIVLPLLVVLTDWFFVAQGNWQAMKERWWVHATVSGMVWSLYLMYMGPAYFAKALGLQLEHKNNIGNVITEKPADKILPFPFFISQFKVILHYLQLFIWPFTMSVEYDWKLVSSFFALDCLVPFIVLVACGYAIVRRLRANPIDPVSFAVLWFAIISAPRSTIIPSTELMADYKTYGASLGVYILLAAGLVWCFDKLIAKMGQMPLLNNFHKQQFALITVLAPLLGMMTYERNMVWSSGEKFWGDIIRHSPGKARAYNNFAVAISEQGRIEEAIPYYKKAMSMDNRYPDPINNVAVCYSMLGKVDEAIAVLKEGIRIQPRYPEGYNNLASFLITKKEYEQARRMLNAALQIRPHYGKAWFNLGKVAMEENKPEEAHVHFKRACTQADLDNESGFKVFASLSLALKKYDDAIFAYGKLCEIEPNDMAYVTNLANAYVLTKEYAKAERLYARVLQTNPRDARAWYNLGDTVLRNNKPEKALKHFTRAKELNPSIINSDLRIADCYTAMGNVPKAREVLERTLKYPKLPAGIATMAKNSLAQLQGSKNA